MPLTGIAATLSMSKKKPFPIAYGRGELPLRIDPELARALRPVSRPALLNAQGRFQEACRHPVETPPLRGVVGPGDRVVIVTSDKTRPVPNRLLIPWILEEIPVPDDKVTVLLGNGSHGANSPDEITEMFGEAVAERVEIRNHDAFDPSQNRNVGKTGDGTEVWMDRVYLEADRRIVVGFIEPHFFAGFSGGGKGVVPGVAGIDTILSLHRADLIAHPKSTWGELEGNPIQNEIADAVSLAPPDFMVNVTLNSEKEITEFFVGDYQAAHRQGCSSVKASAMVPVSEPVPIVVTSNGGYPLDLNLYQTVKGISAADRIVEKGGTILVASECSDGVPDHGNFAELMRSGTSPKEVLQWVHAQDRPVQDQWQAQILAGILERVEVILYSGLAPGEVEGCKLGSTDDLEACLDSRLARAANPSVAVLPYGPLTIPYLEGK